MPCEKVREIPILQYGLYMETTNTKRHSLISRESLVEKLSKRIAIATTKAIHNDQISHLKKVITFQKGKNIFSISEPLKQYTVDYPLQDGEIFIESLYELKLALEIAGGTKKEVRKILTHENDHSSKAESLLSGSHLGYIITLGKDSGGNVSINHVSSIIGTPINMPEITYIDFYTQVISAPLSSGIPLSESDITELTILQERKKKLEKIEIY